MMNAIIDNWIRAGKPLPPPREYKHELILDFAEMFSLKTFIETGTYVGGTLMAVLHAFEHCISIEADENYYQAASKRFKAFGHVSIIHDTSSEVLAEILPAAARDPCLFWLDAHTNEASPILEELNVIGSYAPNSHIILIDDLRLTGSTPKWPSLQQIDAVLGKMWPDHVSEIEDDILRVHP